MTDSPLGFNPLLAYISTLKIPWISVTMIDNPRKSSQSLKPRPSTLTNKQTNKPKQSFPRIQHFHDMKTHARTHPPVFLPLPLPLSHSHEQKKTLSRKRTNQKEKKKDPQKKEKLLKLRFELRFPDIPSGRFRALVTKRPLDHKETHGLGPGVLNHCTIRAFVIGGRGRYLGIYHI